MKHLRFRARLHRPVLTALALVCAVVATAAAAHAASGEPVLDSRQLSCRKQASKFARTTLDRQLETRLRCVGRRAIGTAPASTDCRADPAVLGGAGTGHERTDTKLVKIADQAIAAGFKIERRCAGASTAVLPSDLLLDDVCSPASDEWLDVVDCIYETTRSAVDALVAGLDTNPASTLDAAGSQCVKTLRRSTRKVIRRTLDARIACFQTDDKLAEGGGVLDCASIIMPPGTENSTQYLPADRKITVAWPSLERRVRTKCLTSMATLGYDAVPAIADVTGGIYAGRITLDDVLHGLNDRMQDAMHQLLYGPTGAEGVFAIPGGGYCGDGNLDAGEECDDGNNVSCDGGCDRDCTLGACGNGAVCADQFEECDDGNLVAGDGCDGTCQSEFCGNLLLEPALGEDCDVGGESFDCDANCTEASCGDGDVNSTRGEQCDEGSNTATCDSDCTVPFCPDGHVNPLNTTEGSATAAGEQCDDGNSTPGDGCDPSCLIE